MSLIDALGVGSRELVAFVGAGGKTTTMFRLGGELRAGGHEVVLTTTTRMAATQRHPDLVVCPDPLDSDKVAGPGLGWIEDTYRSRRFSHVLVEADGARGRNVKAPAPLEPVLPPSTSLVVCLIGANALDRVIEDQAHRPLRVAAAAGCSPYDRLTPERAARMLASDLGGRKGVSDGNRFVVAVTQVTDRNAGSVAELRRMLRAEFDVASVLVPPLPAA